MDAHRVSEGGLVMEELRKCPFCGGEARVKSSLLNHWVICLKCGAETEIKLCKKEAIAAWNRRVEG